MPNDFFSGFNNRSGNFLERAAQFNETLFNQFSRAAEMQMEAMRRYTDIASEQARSLAEVRSLEDLKDLSKKQAEALKAMSEQVSSDWQAWQDYIAETSGQLKFSIMDQQESSEPSESVPETGHGRENDA